MTTTTENNKSTHRGSCQACGRVQCVTLHTDKLAKHGYTVDWGHFNGVCAGADVKPLELDKSLTEHIINDLLTNVAPRAEKRAADLTSGAVAPQWFKIVRSDMGQVTEVNCERAELTDAQAARILRSAISHAENRARGARSHASMLEKLIESRHGQPLMPIVIKRELAVGDFVNRGTAKKPDFREVVEIKYAVAHGCGPYLNGQHIKHAFLKSPSGQVYAVPTRSIRQSSIRD
jgi:hypothetical protein